MSLFNINDFKARMDTGLLRGNKFVVSLQTIPKGMNTQAWKQVYDDLPFYCESVDVPGVLLWTDEVKRYGYGPVEKKPYQPAFADARLVFRSDQDGDVFAFIRQWQALALNYQMSVTDSATITDTNGLGNYSNNFSGSPSNVMMPYELGYKAQYAVNVNITQYADDGTPVLIIKLRDAWPSLIVDMPLAWAATRSYAQLPVALVYTDLAVVQVLS